MNRLLTVIAVSGLLGLAGCSSLNPSASIPSGEADALAAANGEGGEFVIPAGGGDSFDRVFTLAGAFGDVFRAPGLVWYEIIPFASNDWALGLGYRKYSTELGDSGWPELDAFTEKAHSSGFYVSYLDSSGSNVNASGDFGLSIGDNTKINVGADGYWFEGSPDTWHASGCVDVMLYLMDELRASAGYRYARLMNGITVSYQFWNASVEYLLKDTGLVLKGSYNREDLNGAPVGVNTFGIGADWYANDILHLGFNTKFMRDDGGFMFGSSNIYEVAIGFQLGNSIISFGWDHLVVTGGGGDSDGFRATVEMPF